LIKIEGPRLDVELDNQFCFKPVYICEPAILRKQQGESTSKRRSRNKLRASKTDTLI